MTQRHTVLDCYNAPIMISMVVVASLAPPAQAGPLRGGSGYFEGSSYTIFIYDAEDDRSWEAAQTFAEHEGGYLATITSSAEDNFILGLAGQSGQLWAGGFQDPPTDAPGANWQWVNGEGPFPFDPTTGSFTYANWQVGEPNDWRGRTEQYLGVNRGRFRQWNDEGNESQVFGFVVEVPEPGSALLLVAGLLGFCRFRVVRMSN